MAPAVGVDRKTPDRSGFDLPVGGILVGAF